MHFNELDDYYRELFLNSDYPEFVKKLKGYYLIRSDEFNKSLVGDLNIYVKDV
jgi:hypothetical protein